VRRWWILVSFRIAALAGISYERFRVQAAQWRAIMAEVRTRPISPHIQIYKWTLPFLMSGFHRITGIVLYFGFVLVAWWLVAAASGPSAYGNVQWFYGTFIGRLVLFGYTWALIHHTLGGIRHLIWDTIHGFEPRETEWLARATIGGSIILTFAVWALGYVVMGGAQ
jgi:succinate dehydrogenase / fumarate reductase cytochrome b subunit